MQRVLIIEKHENIRELLVVAFKREGCEICDGVSWENAIKFLRGNGYDLVIAALEAAPPDGLKMLKTIKLSNPNAEIIVILQANEYNVDSIVSCGVYDYVFKPFSLKDVLNKGKKALEKKKLADRVRNLEQIMKTDKMAL